MLRLLEKPVSTETRYCYPKKHRVIAVYYLPLAAMLENMGVKEAIYESKKRLKKHCSNFLVSIAVDRWNCSNPDFFKIYQELITNSTFFVAPIGPSTSEFQISKLSLNQLDKIGINNLEGGNDLQILKNASNQNFILRPSIAVDLEKGFDKNLKNKIIAIEEISKSTTSVETLTIFPKKRLITKDNESKYISILNQAREHAVSIPFFRAPIAAFKYFKPKHLDVNDYGHFAIELNTAHALDIGMLDTEHQKMFT